MASQTITIAAVSKYQPRVYNGQTSYSVKPQGWTEYLDLWVPVQPQVGQSYEVEVQSRAANNGKVYWSARPVQAQVQPAAPQPLPNAPFPYAPSSSPQNGGRQQAPRPVPTQPALPVKAPLPWDDYVALVREVHKLALELELSDEVAQIALVNTAVIAATNRNLEVPPDANDGGTDWVEDAGQGTQVVPF